MERLWKNAFVVLTLSLGCQTLGAMPVHSVETSIQIERRPNSRTVADSEGRSMNGFTEVLVATIDGHTREIEWNTWPSHGRSRPALHAGQTYHLIFESDDKNAPLVEVQQAGKTLWKKETP